MPEEQNKSVGWVAAMLALGVAYAGWGFMAADYFQNDPTETDGKANFWVNSMAQIAELPERDQSHISEPDLADRAHRGRRVRSPRALGSDEEVGAGVVE